MKKFALALGLFLVAFSAAQAFSGHVFDGSRQGSWTVVQSAVSADFDGRRLTLKGVANTVYFADRPFRVYGHLSNLAFLKAFVRNLAKSRRKDPPNAVLAILGAKPRSVVIEISKPLEAKDGEVTYQIQVLSGNLPKNIPSCSLFIDSLLSGTAGLLPRN